MVYENMLGGDGGEDTLRGLIEFEPETGDQAYLDDVVSGVIRETPALDAKIAEHLKGWTLDRVARVDLSIMRVAVYELTHMRDAALAPSIICAEAVSLAKRFSSENSGRFVNGVLGAVAREMCPQDAQI